MVYQVLVDRFAPSATLDAKRCLYPAPKALRAWDELPRAGKYLPDAKVWSHEIDFWGGDLRSLMGRLDHVQQLGADVLYLNPIHLAYTNHKYDALDYRVVSPEYGTREDVKALAQDLHGRGMRLVLDGVFNHMGRNALVFKQADSSAQNPYRSWFVFGPQYEGGARTWALAQNLPELNLENPAVRDGIDGWRLDVAFDIGPEFLAELTRAAHQEKPGSWVVGEIANYPKEWFPAVDGVLGFTLRQIILRTVNGQIDAPAAARMLDRMVSETGIEPMLKSWVYLGNHDTSRLATAIPDERQRRLAQVLQFTLPGSPNLYYGDELGMLGGEDPEMRAPMRWDLATADNAALDWTRRLVRLHRGERALRVGNFRLLRVVRRLTGEQRFKLGDEAWSPDADLGHGAGALLRRQGPDISRRFNGLHRITSKMTADACAPPRLDIEDCPSAAPPFGDTVLYLRGTMNNWAALDEYALQYSCDAYDLNTRLKGRYEFKPADAAWTPGLTSEGHTLEFDGEQTLRAVIVAERPLISLGPKSFADPNARPVEHPVAQSLRFDSRAPAHKTPSARWWNTRRSTGPSRPCPV